MAVKKFKEEEEGDYHITEVVVTELESLKLQILTKDIQIYHLQAQQTLTQKQGDLQRQLESLKQKYSLNGEWDINPEGTKFVKKSLPT